MKSPGSELIENRAERDLQRSSCPSPYPKAEEALHLSFLTDVFLTYP